MTQRVSFSIPSSLCNCICSSNVLFCLHKLYVVFQYWLSNLMVNQKVFKYAWTESLVLSGTMVLSLTNYANRDIDFYCTCWLLLLTVRITTLFLNTHQRFNILKNIQLFTHIPRSLRSKKLYYVFVWKLSVCIFIKTTDIASCEMLCDVHCLVNGFQTSLLSLAFIKEV